MSVMRNWVRANPKKTLWIGILIFFVGGAIINAGAEDFGVVLNLAGIAIVIVAIIAIRKSKSIPSTAKPSAPNNIYPVSASKQQNASSYLEDIPKKTRDLLWFKNGQYANYTRDENELITSNSSENKTVVDETFGITIDFRTYGIAEPSLIDVMLPVSEPSEVTPKMGYYPSYVEMLPEQRHTYLVWLRDITQPIDIGYAFVFYYGLERHLLYGNFEDAILTIAELQKHHTNDSFRNYSSNALLVSLMKHGKDELLQHINLEYVKNAKLYLFTAVVIFRRLTAKDIMYAHKLFGFTNNRYIKSYPVLFESELEQIILYYYGQDTYPLYDEALNVKKLFSSVLANISLVPRDRSIDLPDISSAKRLTNELRAFLTEAHENTKVKLTESRKKK